MSTGLRAGVCAGAGAVRWQAVPLAGRRRSDRCDLKAEVADSGSTTQQKKRASRRRVLPRAVGSWEGTSDGNQQLNDEVEVAVDAARRAKIGWDVAVSRATLLQLATCAATGIAEPLLGSIDTFWVATLGTTALAALGPNTCVYSSVIAIVAAHGFGTAATRVIAVALEQDEAESLKNKNKMHDGGSPPRTRAGSSMVAVVALTLAFGLTCSVLLLAAPRAVVIMVGATESVVAPAAEYLRVRALGVPAVCLVSVLGGAFQAARDARTPFLAVLLAGAANLVLDPLFIFTFNMGLKGAAAATVVAQYAAALLMAWSAFCGPRRRNFFGAAGGAEMGGGGGGALSAWAFDPSLAWSFAKEVGSMLGRVLNVVAVWGATSVCAARLGVDEGAAHVLLFQIISIISITAGSLTTVANAVASRLSASAGDAAASGAGLAISMLGGGMFAAVAAVFWVLRAPILSFFTTDAVVVNAALLPYPVVIACMVTYWYKALEGALIGRGDANAVNASFTAGGVVCALGLWFYESAGGLSLSRVWNVIFAYYLVITLCLCYRWLTLQRTRHSIPPASSAS